MENNLLASIIINNYNYGRFVRQAIESALSQSYDNLEVIVVDDGSTDNSREIIMGFGDRIIPVLKHNGGQASAFNEGFKSSMGSVIFFLDSDDILYPNAVENAIRCFENENIAKVHWPLAIINEEGVDTGQITPKEKLPEGNFKEHALTSGPPFFLNPPTSGNAWSREFIESVMPLPEAEFRIGADTYFFETVPFFGLIKRIDNPLSAYRIHGSNNYHNKSFSEKLQSELRFYDTLFKTLHQYCLKLQLTPDEKQWRDQSWFHRIANAIEDIRKVVPEKSKMILVDEGWWDMGNELEGRDVYPFTEKDGVFGGVPIDDEQAISELELQHAKGAQFLVITWISFWWLNEYKELSKHLNNNYSGVFENERVVIFDLEGAKR